VQIVVLVVLVTDGLTTIVRVEIAAHCPAVGVNVYVVVVVLFKAGAHAPVMPLLEIVGSGDRVEPEQIDPTAVNVGVMLELTTIVIVAVVAHCPAVGVNVYVVVVVLSKAGDQVPVIPLLEVVGSGTSVAPEQIDPTAVNVGVMLELTTIVSVAVVAHCPASGVNV
jgi:hypothetical protein